MLPFVLCVCFSRVFSLHLQCHELLTKQGEEEETSETAVVKVEEPGSTGKRREPPIYCPDCLKCSHCGKMECVDECDDTVVGARVVLSPSHSLFFSPPLPRLSRGPNPPHSLATHTFCRARRC